MSNSIEMEYPSSDAWEADKGGSQILSFQRNFLTYSWDHSCTEECPSLGIPKEKSYKGHTSLNFKFYAGTEIYFHEEFGIWFFKVLFSGLDDISIPVKTEAKANALLALVHEWESINTI